MPAVLSHKCNEFAHECFHLQPVLLNQYTTKLISVSLNKSSPVHRILGVRDMGSNFYPFTAACNGNKLVTKGLFSKLLNCFLLQPVKRLAAVSPSQCPTQIYWHASPHCRICKTSYLLWPWLFDIWTVRHHWQSGTASIVCCLLDSSASPGQNRTCLFFHHATAYALQITSAEAMKHQASWWILCVLSAPHLCCMLLLTGLHSLGM